MERVVYLQKQKGYNAKRDAMEDLNLFIDKLNQKHIGAYRQLYEQFYKSLVAYASVISLSDEAAEDIVQDLFTALWEGSAKFSSFLSFKSYIYTYVRNASLNYLKHSMVEDAYVQSRELEWENPEDHEEEIEQEERFRLLLLSIEKLPIRMRKVLVLAMEGKKNKEIAEILHVSVDTVKTQKMRAFVKLKDDLGGWILLLLFYIYYVSES